MTQSARELSAYTNVHTHDVKKKRKKEKKIAENYGGPTKSIRWIPEKVSAALKHEICLVFIKSTAFLSFSSSIQDIQNHAFH